jgi:hypothetical protein
MSSENKGTFAPLMGFGPQIMPNYQDKVEWLKVNGRTLI